MFIRPIFLLSIALIFALTAFAKKDPPYLAKLPGDSFSVGKSLAISDTVFYNTTTNPLILRTNSVSNIISLRINEYSNKVLPDSFKLELTIRLIYHDNNGVTDSVTSKVLSIDYNKTNPYKNKDIFVVQGAYYMEVKLLNIAVTYATGAQVLPIVELENRMQVDRDYVMNPITGGVTNTSLNAIKTVNKNETTISTTGELSIYWTPNITIENYDVEWAFLDSSALMSGLYSTAGQPDGNKIFRNNATRITTALPMASIPLIYDGNGVLYYRVRGVQMDPSGEKLTTKWSSDFVSDGGLGSFTLIGHEKGLNWQASTTFAEEAKRKTVVQYFDGGLRARQVVTRDNTTSTTVVAETLYDKQGRNMIQVLPAPTMDNLLKFTPTFNTYDINGMEFSKSVYDSVLGANDYCSDTGKALSNQYGAAKYYSQQNDQAGVGFHQYIPDANGFVYAETQYTQDNTGRIKRQGGVGKDFRIGSGRETKYYYGVPEQKELYALFGTEAGDASHYQKNMVRDANGQYSVSYVDMQGRTVATALAGYVPAGIKQLTDNMYVSLKDDLTDGASSIRKGNSIISSKSFLISADVVATFEYSLGGASLTLEDCKAQNVCYDCLYDITITLSDDCGNANFPDNKPWVFTQSNVNLYSLDTTCNVVSPITSSFALLLKEGAYTITKELKVSEEGMMYYRDSVFLLHNTCKTYAESFNETLTAIRNVLACDNPLDEQTEAESILSGMENDMMPNSGIYGVYPGNLTTSFSIFQKNSSNKYYYQTLMGYMDAGGSPSSVDVASLTPEEFIENFDPAWLKTLVQLHPEYNRFLKYDEFQLSHDWEINFKKINTYAEAKSLGYLNPTGNTTTQPAARFGVNNVDPLYTEYSVSSTAKSAVQNKLFNFITHLGTTATLWNAASISVATIKKMPADTINLFLQPANAFSETRFNTDDLDAAWQSFRDLYVTIKRDWIYDKVSTVLPDAQISGSSIFINSTAVIVNSGLSGGKDSLINRAGRYAAEIGNSVCSQYALIWWEQLTRGCSGLNSTDSAWIIPRLIEVCKQGVDGNHLTGASTVPQASSYPYRSFIDVVKHYVDSTGKGGEMCSGYLIDKPMSYEKTGFAYDKPIEARPDSCECDNLNGLYIEYQTSYEAYSSFSDFMNLKYQTNITQGALDTLRSLCDSTLTLSPFTALKKGLSIPKVMQCVPSNCITCDEFSAGYAAFHLEFPNMNPVMEATTDSLQIINLLFTNFMNQRFGFGKNDVEYLSYLESCTNYFVKDSLVSFYNDFNKNKRPGRILHRYMTSEDENIVGLDNISADGVLQLPDSVRTRSGAWYNNYEFGSQNTNFNTLKGYTIESRIKLERDTLAGNLLVLGFRSIQVVLSSYTNLDGGGVFISGMNINCYSGDPSVPAINFGADYGGNGFWYIKIDSNPYAMMDWMKFKAHITPNKYFLYYNDSLVFTTDRDPANTIGEQQNFGINFRGHNGKVDYFRIGDVNADEMYYEDYSNPFSPSIPKTEFLTTPTTCTSNFVSEFNTKFNSSYNFEQIDSIYRNNFSTIIDVCSNKPDSVDAVALMKSGYSNRISLAGISRKIVGSKYELQVDKKGFSYLAFAMSNPADSTSSDLALLKINPFGKPVWLKNYNYTTHDPVSKLHQYRNGNLLLVSMTENVAKRANLRVLKLDTSGTIIWSKLVDAYDSVNRPLQQYDNHFIEMENGMFALVGRIGETNAPIAYTLFDQDGSILKRKVWSLGRGAITNYSAIGNGDSVTIVGSCINTSVSPQRHELFVVSIDRYTGNAGPQRIMGISGQDIDFGELVYNATGLKAYVTYGSDQHSGSIRLLDNGTIEQDLFLDYQYSMITRSAEHGVYMTKANSGGTEWKLASETPERRKTVKFSPAIVYPYQQLFAQERAGLYLYAKNSDSAFQFNKRQITGGVNPCETLTNLNISSATAPTIAISGLSFTSVADSVISTSSSPVSSGSFAVSNIQVYETCKDSVRKEADVRPLLCNNFNADYLSELSKILDPACADSTNIATMVAVQKFNYARDSIMGEFEQQYLAKCLDVASRESFTFQHTGVEYHYTLYYYDLAGNLVKTVPPEGVRPNRDTTWLSQVKIKAAAGERMVPTHFLATTYQYNTLNQVVKQQTPDAGESEFWYDRLGRLAISQNAQQKLDSKYSYTLYDYLGRINQVGQKKQTTTITIATARNADNLLSWINSTYTFNGGSVVAEEVTSTFYDIADSSLMLPMKIPSQRVHHTLRNRVSYTRYQDVLAAQSWAALKNFDISSSYSYDIHGNVDTLVQQYRTGFMSDHGDNKFKVIAYQYDLISGKVNQVHYQPGEADQFYHRYSYDAENRLTDVYTSAEKTLIGSDVLEDHEAFYSYYKHGPLARMILGQQQVQGVDYAYTLQGWLKGVNSMALDTAFDMGRDGNGSITAKDAFGFQLNYFTGDYGAIGGKNPFPGHSAYIGSEYKPLYNGNISSMGVNIGVLNQPQLYNYAYDQLNRLVGMDTYRGLNSGTNSWSAISVSEDHKERITYDANGNIKTYLRQGNTSASKPQAMDNLSYSYNTDSSGNLINNKLRHVNDAVSPSNYTEDIDGQVADNYQYDAIGNLIKDSAENISKIEWTVYGKLSRVIKTPSTTVGALQELRYRYDAMGNRVSKSAYYYLDGSHYRVDRSWYTRDGSGNVMAIYGGQDTVSSSTGLVTAPAVLKLQEQPVYGAQRLGLWERSVNMDIATPVEGVNLLGAGRSLTFMRGKKFFELGNHLGNVLVTLSDRKTGLDTNTDGLYDSYQAEVRSATDYAPFGSPIPGRSIQQTGYRYGFNGKENDPETKTQDYGMRIYDPRLGKFLSVDPITKSYPELTPYQFASNRPIDGIDQDGLEYLDINKYKQSLWGISKFETIAANYTIGHLEIRDLRIHSVIINHPTNSHVFDNGLEDPAQVNDMVTQKRSSSGKAQALSSLEAKTARREGISDIVGGLVEATKWGVTTGYSLVHKDELQYASASMSALNKADNLVRAAISNPTYPQNLKSSAVLGDLTNYITDLSIPNNVDNYYRQVITQWGNLIFNNEDAISKGTFNFSPQKTVVKPVTLNGPSDLKINLGSIKEKTGNSDPAVNRAYKLIEDKHPNRPTSVRSGSGK